jgi:hypothetical protein
MHVKSILHEFGTCKIDFTYIRYYLAAKIDFMGFPILAAPDPVPLFYFYIFEAVNNKK